MRDENPHQDQLAPLYQRQLRQLEDDHARRRERLVQSQRSALHQLELEHVRAITRVHAAAAVNAGAGALVSAPRRPELQQLQCNVCGQLKPLAAFVRDTTRRLGVRRTCRACHAVATVNAGAGALVSAPPPPELQQLQCSVCGQLKPLAAFVRDTTRRLGVRRTCKACHAAAEHS